ncbi:hypothetical protein [Trebonia kvetii]|nr:hypothetical protein [Trebonia kvetii]
MDSELTVLFGQVSPYVSAAVAGAIGREADAEALERRAHRDLL